MTEEETPPEGGTYTPPASQADLDEIIERRLARERAKFPDYDDLKAKAAKFDEVDAASKSEVQRLQDAVAERDGQLSELPSKIRSQAIRFASLSTQLGFLDPEDALVLVGNVDLEDGDAVKAALADLAERKPHLVRKEPAKTPRRPRPKDGEEAEGDGPGGSAKGKERAAAALRQFRNT